MERGGAIAAILFSMVSGLTGLMIGFVCEVWLELGVRWVVAPAVVGSAVICFGFLYLGANRNRCLSRESLRLTYSASAMIFVSLAAYGYDWLRITLWSIPEGARVLSLLLAAIVGMLSLTVLHILAK